MRTLLDTNVLVGACWEFVANKRVGADYTGGNHVPIMGTRLMDEYETVIGRAALFCKSRLDAAESEELLDIFLSTCRWTPIYFG